MPPARRIFGGWGHLPSTGHLVGDERHRALCRAAAGRDRQLAGLVRFRRVVEHHRTRGAERVRALFVALHRDRVEKRAVRVVQLRLRRVQNVPARDLEERPAGVHRVGRLVVALHARDLRRIHRSGRRPARLDGNPVQHRRERSRRVKSVRDEAHMVRPGRNRRGERTDDPLAVLGGDHRDVRDLGQPVRRDERKGLVLAVRHREVDARDAELLQPVDQTVGLGREIHDGADHIAPRSGVSTTSPMPACTKASKNRVATIILQNMLYILW